MKKYPYCLFKARYGNLPPHYIICETMAEALSIVHFNIKEARTGEQFEFYIGDVEAGVITHIIRLINEEIMFYNLLEKRVFLTVEQLGFDYTEIAQAGGYYETE